MYKNSTSVGSALALTAALLIAVAPVHAQDAGTITGQVTAANTLEPLAGAQVFIPGTGIGALTNGEGRYRLTGVAAGEATVRVQMIGYGQQERTTTVAAGETAVLDFQLTTSAIALEEIVVTGAGQATQRKRLGNTVGTVDASEIEYAPTNSVSDMLQGRIPGVSIAQSGGTAGEGSRIRIRGSASLSQSNEPIIYVNGIRVSSANGFGNTGASSRLDDINPEAIERIEVLKGAAAATLYGTEASNGVIQIFTKDGRAGDTRWNVRIEQGIAKQPLDRYAPHAAFVAPASDTMLYAANARYAQVIPGRTLQEAEQFWGIDSLEPYEVFTTDFMPQVFETGRHQSYSLSVSGGNDLIQYFAAGRFAETDGTFGAENMGPVRDLDTEKQANVNLTIFPADDLRLGVNAAYIDRHHAFGLDGNNIFSGYSMTFMGRMQFATEQNPTGTAAFLTLPEAMNIRRYEDVSRFTGGLHASWAPLQSVNIDATFGVDQVNLQGVVFQRYGWNVSGFSSDHPRGERTVLDRNYRSLTFDVRTSWNTTISDDFSSALVVGAQALTSSLHEVEVYGATFPAPGLEVAEAGTNQEVGEFIENSAQVGVFAQEQVGFRDYLFVTAGVRYDSHSAFGESAGGVLYPKLSVSFVPSDMDGWSNSLFSTLRLRSAIGQSGLQPDAFAKFTTFSPLPSALGPGVEPDNLGNDELKPETSTEWELGADLGLFGGRAALQATYWNRTVTNVLIERQFAPSGGFLAPQLYNLGEMKAWGVELGANGRLVSTPDVSISLFATAAYLYQEVTDMGGAPPIKIGYYRYRNWIKEGYAPGAFFGPKLVDPAAGRLPFDVNGDNQADTREQVLAYLSQPRLPGQIPLLLADVDGDGDYLDHYLGKPFPDWQGSFGADITFLDNFTLSTLFEFKAGNFFTHDLGGAFRSTHILLGRNTPAAARMEATLLNPESTPEERLDAALYWAQQGASLAPYNALNAIKPADFLRWREVSLTYRLPSDLVGALGARSLAVTAGVRNAMLWTTFSGVDPEVNVVTSSNFLVGVGGWRTAIPRRFTLAVDVGF